MLDPLLEHLFQLDVADKAQEVMDGKSEFRAKVELAGLYPEMDPEECSVALMAKLDELRAVPGPPALLPAVAPSVTPAARAWWISRPRLRDVLGRPVPATPATPPVTPAATDQTETWRPAARFIGSLLLGLFVWKLVYSFGPNIVGNLIGLSCGVYALVTVFDWENRLTVFRHYGTLLGAGIVGWFIYWVTRHRPGAIQLGTWAHKHHSLPQSWVFASAFALVTYVILSLVAHQKLKAQASS